MSAETPSPLPPGHTRAHVGRNHAVVAPDSHVVAPLHGWTNTEGVVLISPAMGPDGCGPGIVQTLVHLTPDSVWQPDASAQRFFYVLEGEVSVDGQPVGPDGYAWLPPGDTATPTCSGSATLMAFTKPYVALPGTETPGRFVGHINDVTAEPFMGDPAARLAKLLPQEPGFDLEVNRFTFDPGAVLPLVESHVNEHGLYMLEGQGLYRLGTGTETTWAPVQQGDAIWMGAFCPQWFCCFGKGPATYLYSKDVNRSVF